MAARRAQSQSLVTVQISRSTKRIRKNLYKYFFFAQFFCLWPRSFFFFSFLRFKRFLITKQIDETATKKIELFSSLPIFPLIDCLRDDEAERTEMKPKRFAGFENVFAEQLRSTPRVAVFRLGLSFGLSALASFSFSAKLFFSPLFEALVCLAFS